MKFTEEQKIFNAFIQYIYEAKEFTYMIQDYLDDHMEADPDDLAWVEVAEAARLRDALRDIAETFNLIK